jgi:hypothetical protein
MTNIYSYWRLLEAYVSEEIVVDNEAPPCTTKTTNDNTCWDLPEARHLFGYMNPVNN